MSRQYLKRPRVYRAKPSADIQTFLIRNIGKRAIVIRIYLKQEDMARWSEFEISDFCESLAKLAHKRGWKSATATFCGNPVNYSQMMVYFRNKTGTFFTNEFIGCVDDFVDFDHFLNEDYYSSAGLWIKNTGSQEK